MKPPIRAAIVVTLLIPASAPDAVAQSAAPVPAAVAIERALEQDAAPPPATSTSPPLTAAGQPLADLVQLDRRQATGQPDAEKPPQPAHTGFDALVRTTGSDFAAFPRRPSTYVILGIGAAAAAVGHPFDDEVNEEIQESKALGRFFTVGKIVGNGWFQAGAAVGTYLVGRYLIRPEEGHTDDGHPDEHRTNKVSHIGFDLVRATIVTQSLTYGLKLAVRRDRPTGECCSFPSGHASATFATASVLERHFGARGAWPTFAIAGYVAMSRLSDNRHFLSDVLFGSALGVASGWTVVGRHGRNSYALLPVPVDGGWMVTLMRTRPAATAP